MNVELIRSSHAVGEANYHIQITAAYRRQIFADTATQVLTRDYLLAGAARHGITVAAIGFGPDHVHLFVSAPPRWSPAELVNVLKSVSAKQLFKEFPRLRETMWGGALWSEGYFVRATGDAVTAQVLQRYIRYQRVHEEGPRQLRFTF